MSAGHGRDYVSGKGLNHTEVEGNWSVVASAEKTGLNNPGRRHGDL